MSNNAALRLEVAKALIQIAGESNRPVSDKIREAARHCRVGFDYAAATFWELVRLGFLSSRGRLVRRLAGRADR